jgi:hypothetical protein
VLLTPPAPAALHAVRHQPSLSSRAFASALQPIPASDVKNANLTFDVNTQEPGPITGKQGAVRTTTERPTITDIAFTSATITVFQGPTCAQPPFTAPKAGCNQVVIQETFTLYTTAQREGHGA